MLGMRGCVHHQIARKAPWRIPAMMRRHGFAPPIGQDQALKPVMLDVIRHQDLQPEHHPEKQQHHSATKTTDPDRAAHRQCGQTDPCGIGCVQHVGLAPLAREPVGFAGQPRDERTPPGPWEIGPKAFAGQRRVGVIYGADMAVVHQPMCGNMVAETRHTIDKRAQAARQTRLAMDQLMRIGMADLAHEACLRQDEDDALARR